MNGPKLLGSLPPVTEDPDLLAAGGGPDAGHLLIAADLAERDRQRHQVNVEPALGVLARRAKLQQIEDRLDVGVEAVVTLTGKRGVAAIEGGDRLSRIPIEIARDGDAIPGRVLAVVILVVERRGIPLVVRWDDAAPEDLAPVPAVIHLRHAIALCQVLRRIVHVLDDAQVRLEDGLRVLERRVETELVAVRRTPGLHVVVAGGDVDLVQHVVVEVELVGPDAGLLEGIDGERGDEHLDAIVHLDEGVNVGGVGGVVQGDQGSIHVARRHGRSRRRGEE